MSVLVSVTNVPLTFFLSAALSSEAPAMVAVPAVAAADAARARTPLPWRSSSTVGSSGRSLVDGVRVWWVEPPRRNDSSESRLERCCLEDSTGLASRGGDEADEALTSGDCARGGVGFTNHEFTPEDGPEAGAAEASPPEDDARPWVRVLSSGAKVTSKPAECEIHHRLETPAPALTGPHVTYVAADPL